MAKWDLSKLEKPKEVNHIKEPEVVKKICSTWIAEGKGDECFWEGWPECPTPEDSLTPKMVLNRIEELEGRLFQCGVDLDTYMNLSEKLEALLIKAALVVRTPSQN